MKPVSLLQRVEIGNDVLPIGLIGEIDEHFGAVDETGRVPEEFVEIGVVPGDVGILHAAEKSNPGTVPLLLPTIPGRDGPTLFSPGVVAWHTAQWDEKTFFAGRRIAGCQRGR